MGLMRLCDDDPLLDSLRDLFDATPLRTPEDRIQPLTLLSRKGHQARFLGNVEHAIDAFKSPPTKSGSMAELSGKQSRSVDAKLGINILSGFLSGFGVEAAGVASINFALQDAVSVKFSFGQLERSYVDLVQLGREVAGRHLQRNNPALEIFLGDDSRHDLLIVDSVLRSGTFTLSVEATLTSKLSIDGPTVKNAIEGTGNFRSVDASDRAITFSGKKKLPFAFSCAQIELTTGGRIAGLTPGAAVRQLGAVSALEQGTARSEPFFKETGLLVWEE